MTAGSSAPAPPGSAAAPGRPRACTTSCGPSRPAGRRLVARFAALVEARRLRARHHARPRARRRLPARHRRGRARWSARRCTSSRTATASSWRCAPRARRRSPAPSCSTTRSRPGRPGTSRRRSATRTPSTAATASTTSWVSRRSGPPTPTSTSRWSRWPTTSSPGSGCAQVTLKLHSMGDGVCQPGLRRAARRLPGRAGRPALPGRTGPATWRTRCGCSTARPPSAGPPPRTRPASSTTSATPARPTSPGCGPASTRSASPTPSTTAWSAASTTTPAPRSSSPPRRSTRPRTASAAAAATTGWSSCSAASPTPGIGFGIGIERVLLACDAEGVFATGRRRGARPLHAYVIDTAGGESAVALTAELRRAGLRADRAFDGRSMKSQIKSADRSGALVALVVGTQELAEGTVGPAAAAQRRGAAHRAPGCHCGRAQELPGQRGVRRGIRRRRRPAPAPPSAPDHPSEDDTEDDTET